EGFREAPLCASASRKLAVNNLSKVYLETGYARVSTQDQSPALQLDALRAAGCEQTFEEKASGAQRDRPELKAALGYIRKGDVLVVWKLDEVFLIGLPKSQSINHALLSK